MGITAEDKEPTKKPLQSTSDSADDLDPTDEDVGDVFKRIASYMQIIKKNTVQIVPNANVFYIIRKVEKFIENDLLYQIVMGIGEIDVCSLMYLSLF